MCIITKIITLFYSTLYSDVLQGRIIRLHILTPLITSVVAVQALVRIESDVAIDDLKTSRSKTSSCNVHFEGISSEDSSQPRVRAFRVGVPAALYVILMILLWCTYVGTCAH